MSDSEIIKQPLIERLNLLFHQNCDEFSGAAFDHVFSNAALSKS